MFTLFWRKPGLGSAGLLALPAVWFIFCYLAAIIALLISAFWTVDPLSGQIEPTWNLDNFRQLLADPVYRTIALRTVFIAAAVTVSDAVMAWPFAYVMVRLAGPRMRVLLPLWSSYLARVYAWRLILAHDGALNWALHAIGLPGASIGYSNWAMWIVFSYLWLPFMILPLYAALE